MRIVPAILTEDFAKLETMVRQAESFTDYVQFDIMDGRFVPSRSITADHLARINMKLNWEAHLMVLRPEDYLEDFQRAGAKKIVFHYETTDSPGEIISRVKSLNLQVGLAVNPETPASAVLPLCGDIDSVLLLTVNPGFYGKEFLPEVMDKIAELRQAPCPVEIGIDGGVKEGNIAMIARSRPDVIFVGSAIFLQPRPDESYHNLVALAQKILPPDAD